MTARRQHIPIHIQPITSVQFCIRRPPVQPLQGVSATIGHCKFAYRRPAAAATAAGCGRRERRLPHRRLPAYVHIASKRNRPRPPLFRTSPYWLPPRHPQRHTGLAGFFSQEQTDPGCTVSVQLMAITHIPATYIATAWVFVSSA